MSKPTVSVIIPAYNAERFVGEAVDSILAQTWEDFELLIIDDCSTDGTREVLATLARRDKRIRLLYNDPNRHVAATMNRGLEAARGEFFARLDADDLAMPQRLEKQVGFLRRQPEVGVVGGAMELIDEQQKPLGQRFYPEDDATLRRRIFFCSPFCSSTVFARRQLALDAGGYDPSFTPSDDYELYFRLGRLAAFANLPEVLVRYRVLADSLTNADTVKMERQTIRIRRRYFPDPAYPTSLLARLYDIGHWTGIHLTPASLRVKLFSMIRDRKAGGDEQPPI